MENLSNLKIMQLIKLDMHCIKKIKFLKKLHIQKLCIKFANN